MNPNIYICSCAVKLTEEMYLKHTTKELFEIVEKFNWVWTGVTKKNALYNKAASILKWMNV